MKIKVICEKVYDSEALYGDEDLSDGAVLSLIRDEDALDLFDGGKWTLIRPYEEEEK